MPAADIMQFKAIITEKSENNNLKTKRT